MTVQNKTIGEHEFTVAPWGARVAMINKLKIAKIFGTGAMELMRGAGREDSDQVEFMAAAMNVILDHNDPEKVIDLIIEMVCSQVRDGKRMDPRMFDQYFQEDLMDAYKTFIFVLEVNYKDFFVGLMNGNFRDQA